ncbi:MAG: IS110 family transposase [Hyphomicrobiaceae bacterium]|nr:MAG: IS110 family transposase [Hyphomicrobiaceae bacterium]
MRRSWHFIGMDVHAGSSELASVSERGQLLSRWSGPTAIPRLLEAIEAVPRYRSLAFEEGPLADWLLRNLTGHVDEIIVSDPARNALIAKDSDKDDPIDAEKLAQLLRGGYLRAVHHPESLERLIFKQHVGLYQQQVCQRVHEANRVLAYLLRWGVFAKERDLVGEEARKELRRQLPKEPTVQGDLSSLLASYDTAAEQHREMRKRLVALGRKEPQIRRWIELPGVSWIRAATVFAYLDTPWRFRSKEALWRYMGIGLGHHGSGGGPMRVRVSPQANRRLKCAILGAAKTAIASKDNPFAEQHEVWIHEEISPRNARRNVARSLAAVMWGMWKNGSEYRPEWVGRPGVELAKEGLEGRAARRLGGGSGVPPRTIGPRRKEESPQPVNEPAAPVGYARRSS